MIYTGFDVHRFRGVADASISLVKNDLILLLGLNESGKTTILRAIEAFDLRNDPNNASAMETFYASIRNKSDEFSNESAVVSAQIELEQPLNLTKKMLKGILTREEVSQGKLDLAEAFIQAINQSNRVTIKRVFPFKEGGHQKPFYAFDSTHVLAENDPDIAHRIAKLLVSMCPFIIYFEDFTDRIPEKIFISPRNDAFRADWYDIVDGLFYNTMSQYSIEKFKKFFSRTRPRRDDAQTMMNRVNAELNKVFTKKWEELSGVQEIESTELIAHFQRTTKYFEIKVSDTDGTTYSVDERSKGALWYLAFLMKTEFRRKKMRQDSGKPIFLIDEPASNLHSTAQTNMIEDFKKLVEDTSVIYTTHSQYLISLDNIKNTYVIRRKKGVVSAVVWADFIREEAPTVNHYQPLANLLQLIPNSLVVPWEKAIITEGPSDRNVLELMYRVVSKSDPGFVIYPGTNAYNLETLISLNIAWNADFRVVLDSDEDGQKAQKKYKEKFELDKGVILTLPLPSSKIEDYFSKDERSALYKLAFDREKEDKAVTKNEFKHSVSILNGRADVINSVESVLTESTKKRFKELFDTISLN